MELGQLSAQYESNGDPGAISHTPGDAGGASYGAYQFASAAGVPQAFIQWLTNYGHTYGPALANAGEVGSDSFDQEWSYIAQNDPLGFKYLQHDYVKAQYFDVAVANLASVGYDILSHSMVLQNVVWSAAVQYGPHYIVELFQTSSQEAGVSDPNELSEKTLITNIYDVRASDDWTSGSPSLRPGLRNRFASECQQALEALG